MALVVARDPRDGRDGRERRHERRRERRHQGCETKDVASRRLSSSTRRSKNNNISKEF
jgi:hypothetical protein